MYAISSAISYIYILKLYNKHCYVLLNGWFWENNPCMGLVTVVDLPYKI